MASPYSIDAELRTENGDIAVLTYSDLDVASIISAVSENTAGAIATFVGQTRNNFQGKMELSRGKRVTHLEYESYSALAITTMLSILNEARGLASAPLSRIALHHRLGEAPVGTVSIVVAVSSPHRREAFEACSWIVDEVKRRAQIFKREYYEGEPESQAVWKQNV